MYAGVTSDGPTPLLTNYKIITVKLNNIYIVIVNLKIVYYQKGEAKLSVQNQILGK